MYGGQKNYYVQGFTIDNYTKTVSRSKFTRKVQSPHTLQSVVAIKRCTVFFGTPCRTDTSLCTNCISYLVAHRDVLSATHFFNYYTYRDNNIINQNPRSGPRIISLSLWATIRYVSQYVYRRYCLLSFFTFIQITQKPPKIYKSPNSAKVFPTARENVTYRSVLG